MKIVRLIVAKTTFLLSRNSIGQASAGGAAVCALSAAWRDAARPCGRRTTVSEVSRELRMVCLNVGRGPVDGKLGERSCLGRWSFIGGESIHKSGAYGHEA
jgi:hypothetical protein